MATRRERDANEDSDDGDRISKRQQSEPVAYEADSQLVDSALRSGNLDSGSDDDVKGIEGNIDSVSASDDEEGSSSEESKGDNEESASGEEEEESNSDPEEDRKLLTEQERYSLQSQYQKLDEELLRQRPRVAIEGGVGLVAESLSKVDELFQITKTTLHADVTAQDTSTLREIGYQANLATKNLKLGRSEKLLSFDDFASHFNAQFAMEDNNRSRVVDERDELPKVNWLDVGLLMGRFSYRATTCEFLLGGLELAKKQRQTRQRLHDDSRSAVTKTATATNAEEVARRENADVTAVNSERLFRKLCSLNFAKVPLFEVFLDPNSFAHSVENLFYTSFLVSNNKVILSRDESGLPYIQQASRATCQSLKRYKEGDESRSHVILNLDYETWKNLVKEYDIKESFLEAEE
ncbi:DEKNAAC102950 [Brettanomyces naardenensis]|uniref:Non-structural maintenance of chromosomes element 4 n=1 Tax=Brettanomyces naardenensis TaxID=13370 RepID=A0A448YM12_BRENA|nr:DEKNAAC102950 [Brettanomyces naardenensis]